MDLKFDDNLRPLWYIPDVYSRHHVQPLLGLIWAVRFLLSIGIYLFLDTNILEQSIITAAAAVTTVVHTVVANRLRHSCAAPGGRLDGEND